MKQRLPARIPYDLSLGGGVAPSADSFFFDIYWYDRDAETDLIAGGVLPGNPFVVDVLMAMGLIGAGLVQTQIQATWTGPIGSGDVQEQEQDSTIGVIGSGSVQALEQVSTTGAIGNGSVQAIVQAAATGAIGNGVIILSETSYD